MKDATPSEPLTMEVSGFYGPGSLLAWRLTLLSAILTSLAHHQGRLVNKNVALIELIGLNLYPILAAGDLLLKWGGARGPYDWSLLGAIDDFRPYKFITYLIYGTPFDQHLSTSIKSQFVDLYLPCLVIDNYLPIIIFALEITCLRGNALLPPLIRYLIIPFIFLGGVACFLGAMFANISLITLPTDEDQESLTEVMVVVAYCVVIKLGYPFMFLYLPTPLKSLFIFPPLYTIARELADVTRLAVSESPATIELLKSHFNRIFCQIAIFAWALSCWCILILVFGTLALVPVYPDIGLSFGDLDQLATLCGAVVLFCYSLYDFFDGFDWRRLTFTSTA